MKNLKNTNKGITLIALVITIIVLLILAGVALAALTGDSGILSNAESAKRQTQKANAKEQVQLAIQGALTDITEGVGKVTYGKLVKELQNIVEGTYSVEETGEGTWTVTVNGYKFQVTENGSIQEISGISLSQVTAELTEGETVKLTATLTQGIAGTITWTSSDENVATVADETVTAVAGGTATITASITSDGETYEAKCEVTVVSKVTAITLTETTLELILGESKGLTVTTTPSENVESLTYVSSDTAVATVDSTGKVTAKGEGEATITVAGKTSIDVKATCAVTVTIPESAPIGDYVTYKVSYTDMYSDINEEEEGLQGFEFGPENGWRILYGGTSNGDGTYSGVKLISTGIPAKLFYDYDINTEEEKNGWWGTNDQVAKLYDTADVKYSEAGYIYDNGGYPNRYAAAGLLENFKSIPFTAGTIANNNKGYFTRINSTNSGDLATDAFIKAGASEVHNLTLEELNTARGTSFTADSNSTIATGNDAATGLFYLKNLGSEFGYSSASSSYWLASPYSANSLRCVSSGGGIDNISFTISGVRPVVSLSSKIQKNAAGNWEIVEQ